MEKKRFYKVIRASKYNGEIREFPFTLPYTFNEAYALALDFAWNHFPFSDCSVLAICPVDPPVPRMAEYVVTFEDRTDTLLCSYRVVAENGIKAIDVAISDFKNDYHHGDVDVVGLERCK